ncbi:MAG TPA: DUF305 domain-containing protein [Gemmatimonadaceae bacterium]|jgi:uncharacterized protein (DUF305 family)|nr:DUF305 domain-containing protein [Gemmatimonadaceae bacterium]
MKERFNPAIALFSVTLACVGCASGQAAVNRQQSTGAATAPVAAASDTAAPLYTRADIEFMDGMIAHHAQALLMASWADSHGASPTIRTLTDRITNAQKDEIVAMQKWLRDRHQPVPEPDPHGMTMDMGGMHHEMLMPGMLTDDQLKQLDAARSKEFDRLFLVFMIQHHKGAVTMVDNLFATNGAAQDITVYKMASDISADQTTEIARMQKMLAAMVFDSQAQ